MPKSKGKRDRLFDALAISMKVEAEMDRSKRLRTENDNETNESMEEEELTDQTEPVTGEDMKSNDNEFGPYQSELSYLEDQVRANILLERIVELKVKLDTDEDDVLDRRSQLQYERDMAEGRYGRLSKMDENAKYQKEKKLEKTEAMAVQLQKKISAKIHASVVENGKVFRLEQLCEALHLGSFEKSCILRLIQQVIVPAPQKLNPYAMESFLKTTVGKLVRENNRYSCDYLFSIA